MAGVHLMKTWEEITARFKPGDSLDPLVGTSKLTVDSVDSEQICIRQRLWVACVTGDDVRIAWEILDAAPAGITPIQLSELIRNHYQAGPDVATDCTRIPNLSAVVLLNLGALSPAAPTCGD
jgi:hypothetical protein